MAQLKSIKRWFWWHRWPSLICTLFLLLLCLTGLPLVFSGEIDGRLNPTHYAEMPANTPMANLNGMIKQGKLSPSLSSAAKYGGKKFPRPNTNNIYHKPQQFVL
ncbi:PepSY domain-containing protein [Mucilaginibacter angelicae]|uniref:PepSY domain-containing protein n=1 Tax=Mucilaginibacter angelicae TaxID=869718 RepID=A0ABV6LAA0_9SPHI